MLEHITKMLSSSKDKTYNLKFHGKIQIFQNHIWLVNGLDHFFLSRIKEMYVMCRTVSRNGNYKQVQNLEILGYI